jgi:hypothetical protein
VPFKQFLCELDDDYLMGKLDHRDWFDFDETIKAVKHDILEWRKSGSLDKKGAKAAWDELLKIADEVSTPDELYHAFDDSEHLDCLTEDFGEVVRYGFQPDLRQFVARLWPVFVDALKKEIAANGS